MTSGQRKGYRILLTTFEISKTTTRRSNRECFNQVVRFLADCVRIHPMPTDELPLFRGLKGEQRWEEDYHKR